MAACPVDELTAPVDWEPTATERTQFERLLRPSAGAGALPTYAEVVSAAYSDLPDADDPPGVQAAGGDAATATTVNQPVTVLLVYRNGPTLCRQLRALLSQRGGAPNSIFIDAFGAGAAGEEEEKGPGVLLHCGIFLSVGWPCVVSLTLHSVVAPVVLLLAGAESATRLAESMDPTTALVSVFTFTAVGSSAVHDATLTHMRHPDTAGTARHLYSSAPVSTPSL